MNVMNFGRVELPREVEEAINEDRLVVFAGAGVSMPPPSNLPSFNKLAQNICGKTVDAGREDRMLGDAQISGTNIYGLCARRLHGDHTSHTELHENILNIFKESSSVRIITTNFDNHFSTAAQKVYPEEQPKEYYAPTLPLGDSFQGIVYLHGSVVEDSSKPILTDRDFGEAYLTRGWATTFLIDLFSEYTVLFVGYSHKDVTITYLARGLKESITAKKWALCRDDAKAELHHWQRLGIDVMPFSLNSDNAENKYSQLSDFFSGWADHQKTSLKLKAERAKKMAGGLPPKFAHEQSFIKHCLDKNELRLDFLSSIKHPAWFSWLEENQYFDKIFSGNDAALGDSDKEIANWLATFIRIKHPYLLFDIILREQHRLHSEFANMLGDSVWVNSKEKKTDKHFAHWIHLLISCDKLRASSYLTTDLLNQCILPKDKDIALQIFEIVTKPKLMLEERFPCGDGDNEKSDKKASAQKPSFKIVFHGDSYGIVKAWKNILTPHLDDIAEPLLRLCEKQVYDTYSLQSLINGSVKSHDSDSLSWHRSPIASHEQDEYPLYKTFSCLVDILRDILQYLLNNNYQKAVALRDEWWSSGILIFKRLSVFAYSIDDSISSDEAIRWLLEQDLIFRSGMKKEVFEVLAKTYNSASSKTRKRLLQQIARGYKDAGAKNSSSDNLAYQKFNVLIWLKRHTTSCQLLEDALQKIKEKHPNFQKRDHLESHHWISVDCVDPSEGFDFDKILSNPPSEFIQSLRSSREDSFKKDRWCHLDVLKTLFERKHEWGCDFIRQLSKENDISVDTWNSVWFALRAIPKSNDDWKWLLTLLEELPREKEIYSGVAYLISNSFYWKQESKPTDDSLDRAVRLMKEAWKLSRKDTETTSSVNRDWLTTAINHIGGWIGVFWVRYCCHLYNRDPKNWKGIPKDIQDILVQAISGKSATEVNARISLIPWMGYWYDWDSDFFQKYFLPLLDWSQDSVVAQQTWSVLLSYDKGTSHDLEQILIPFYRDFADKISDLLKETANNIERFDPQALQNFGSRIAAITMIEETNPIESNFVNEFILAMPETSRVGFADWIKRFLKKSDNSDKADLWNLWLREYITLRLLGKPIPLSPEEGNCMLEWCLYLTPVFCDAVKLLTKVPTQKVFSNGILKDLASSPVADDEPLFACKLANAAMEAENYPYLREELPELHKKWGSIIKKDETFSKFEELMFKRGWRG